MGSRAVMEVVSSAGLLGSCSTSTSTSSSPRLLLQRPKFVSPSSRRIRGVRALVEPRPRRAFGRGPASPRRLDVRAQATKQTFTSFDDMLKNCETPVLVDFYAVWCGPCQMMVPILNQVSSSLQDKLRIVKIDTEKYPDLASRFDIHALPTLVLFKNGKEADRIEGVLRAEELVNRVQKNL